MTQYWHNGIMLGIVTEQEANKIIQNSKNAGFKVYDKTMPNHFSVDDEPKKGKRKKLRGIK